MSRIARDSPGLERNVPRPGQVDSGTMRRTGMNYSGAKFSVAVMFFKNWKVKIYLQQNKVLQNENFSVGVIFRLCSTHPNHPSFYLH